MVQPTVCINKLIENACKTISKHTMRYHFVQYVGSGMDTVYIFWGMFSENTRNETFVSVSKIKVVHGDANFSLSVVCIYFLHVDIHMNVKCEYV